MNVKFATYMRITLLVVLNNQNLKDDYLEMKCKCKKGCAVAFSAANPLFVCLVRFSLIVFKFVGFIWLLFALTGLPWIGVDPEANECPLGIKVFEINFKWFGLMACSLRFWIYRKCLSIFVVFAVFQVLILYMYLCATRALGLSCCSTFRTSRGKLLHLSPILWTSFAEANKEVSMLW